MAKIEFEEDTLEFMDAVNTFHAYPVVAQNNLMWTV